MSIRTHANATTGGEVWFQFLPCSAAAVGLNCTAHTPWQLAGPVHDGRVTVELWATTNATSLLRAKHTAPEYGHALPASVMFKLRGAFALLVRARCYGAWLLAQPPLAPQLALDAPA